MRGGSKLTVVDEKVDWDSIQVIDMNPTSRSQVAQRWLSKHKLARPCLRQRYSYIELGLHIGQGALDAQALVIKQKGAQQMVAISQAWDLEGGRGPGEGGTQSELRVVGVARRRPDADSPWL